MESGVRAEQHAALAASRRGSRVFRSSLPLPPRRPLSRIVRRRQSVPSRGILSARHRFVTVRGVRAWQGPRWLWRRRWLRACGSRRTVQVWFYRQQGSDVLKAEPPFAVAQEAGGPVKKKSSKRMRGPTLQEFELVPVTDAAERAALDRRCRAAERAGKGKPTKRK